MGHTLGMLHEQSRTDRNSFMTINWKNIVDGKEGNFFKSSTNIHDNVDPYSAMQYYLWVCLYYYLYIYKHILRLLSYFITNTFIYVYLTIGFAAVQYGYYRQGTYNYHRM